MKNGRCCVILSRERILRQVHGVRFRDGHSGCSRRFNVHRPLWSTPPYAKMLKVHRIVSSVGYNMHRLTFASRQTAWGAGPLTDRQRQRVTASPGRIYRNRREPNS
jgi:hypothetical protein